MMKKTVTFTTVFDLKRAKSGRVTVESVSGGCRGGIQLEWQAGGGADEDQVGLIVKAEKVWIMEGGGTSLSCQGARGRD